RARALWLVAGAQAVDRMAFDHAVDCLSRALTLSEVSERVVVLRELAQALSMAGHARKAAERFSECAQLSAPGERPSLLERAAIESLVAGEIDTGLARLRALFAELGVRLPASSASLALGLLRQQLLMRLRTLSYDLDAPANERAAHIADLAFATSAALRPVD